MNRLMDLYEGGSISSEIIEDRINHLESERADLKKSIKANNQLPAAINIAESELDTKIIKDYIDKFEDLLNNSNQELMRQFLENFLTKIELGRNHAYKKEAGKSIYMGLSRLLQG